MLLCRFLISFYSCFVLFPNEYHKVHASQGLSNMILLTVNHAVPIESMSFRVHTFPAGIFLLLRASIRKEVWGGAFGEAIYGFLLKFLYYFSAGCWMTIGSYLFQSCRKPSSHTRTSCCSRPKTLQVRTSSRGFSMLHLCTFCCFSAPHNSYATQRLRTTHHI